jgi:hypothetical protein
MRGRKRVPAYKHERTQMHASTARISACDGPASAHAALRRCAPNAKNPRDLDITISYDFQGAPVRHPRPRVLRAAYYLKGVCARQVHQPTAEGLPWATLAVCPFNRTPPTPPGSGLRAGCGLWPVADGFGRQTQPECNVASVPTSMIPGTGPLGQPEVVGCGGSRPPCAAACPCIAGRATFWR